MKSPISSFFATFSWRTGLLYGLLISLLSAYAWNITQAQKSRTASYTDSISTFEGLQTMMSEPSRDLMTKIDKKESLAFGADASKYQKAHNIEKFIKTNDGLIQQKLNALSPINVDSWDKPASEFGSNFYAELLQGVRSTADSLRYWAHGDASLLQVIDSIFSHRRLTTLETLLAKGNRLEKALVVSMLQFEQQYCAYVLLTRLYEQLPRYDAWSLYNYLPTMLISSENRCLKVGDLFEAAFFASCCPKRMEHVQFLVNDKPIPIVNGIGQYSPTYNTPGEKMIQFKVLIINPLTNDTSLSSKDCRLKICD